MPPKLKMDHKRRRKSDEEYRTNVTNKSLKKTGEEATLQTARRNKKDHFFATKEHLNDSTDEEDYNDEENPLRDYEVRNESFSTTALSSQFDQLKEKVAQQELAIQRLLSLVDDFQSQPAEDRNEIVTLKDTSFVLDARIQQLQTELDKVKQYINMEKIGKDMAPKSKTDHKRRRKSDVESRTNVTKKSSKKTREATLQTSRRNKKSAKKISSEDILCSASKRKRTEQLVSSPAQSTRSKTPRATDTCDNDFESPPNRRSVGKRIILQFPKKTKVTEQGDSSEVESDSDEPTKEKLPLEKMKAGAKKKTSVSTANELKENINDRTDDEDYNDEENPSRDCDVRNESFSTTALSSQFDQLKEKVAEQELAIQRLLSLVDDFQSQRAEDRNEIVTLKDLSVVQGARIQQLQTELDKVKQDINMEKIGKEFPRREFELPEPLIQLIHSFLPTKEAAQTTLLSKSWLKAWLTRSNLVFDLSDFSPFPDINYKAGVLLDYAEKTIRRYEMSNIKIQSFTLHRFTSKRDRDGRLTNLILGALKVGATRLRLHVSGCLHKCPNEVFASENLVSLALNEVRIDLGQNPMVAFPMLRSLILEHLIIESSDMLLHIISSCPLIEKLELCCIWFCGDDRVGGDDRLIELRRLRSLLLDDTDLFTVFLNGLSSKFPSLEDLTLCLYIGETEEDVLISSPSLERLDLTIKGDAGSDSNEIRRVKFDLPSICKLTFEGSDCDHYRNNRPGSMVWESDDDVSATHHHTCLTANTMDFLGVKLLQGLNVRISNLRQLMYNGLNDLKEARAQIFDKDASMWRDVPLLHDSTVPEDNPFVGFQLTWQPKQKKLN